jgi:hypothetical protein
MDTINYARKSLWQNALYSVDNEIFYRNGHLLSDIQTGQERHRVKDKQKETMIFHPVTNFSLQL